MRKLSYQYENHGLGNTICIADFFQKTLQPDNISG